MPDGHLTLFLMQTVNANTRGKSRLTFDLVIEKISYIWDFKGEWSDHIIIFGSETSNESKTDGKDILRHHFSTNYSLFPFQVQGRLQLSSMLTISKERLTLFWSQFWNEYAGGLLDF